MFYILWYRVLYHGGAGCAQQISLPARRRPSKVVRRAGIRGPEMGAKNRPREWPGTCEQGAAQTEGREHLPGVEALHRRRRRARVVQGSERVRFWVSRLQPGNRALYAGRLEGHEPRRRRQMRERRRQAYIHRGKVRPTWKRPRKVRGKRPAACIVMDETFLTAINWGKLAVVCIVMWTFLSVVLWYWTLFAMPRLPRNEQNTSWLLHLLTWCL